VFGFRHQLPITSDEAAFKDAVQATNISGNIDSPEGGFDALMQIAVCQVRRCAQIGKLRNQMNFPDHATEKAFS